MVRWSLAAVTAVLLVPLAGCGDDRDTQASSAPPQANEADATVEMRNIQFEPKNLVVRPGTTVRWTNYDDVVHTVTVAKSDAPSEGFDSGNVFPGASYQHTFEQRGRIDYVCTLHHGQQGSVLVE